MQEVKICRKKGFENSLRDIDIYLNENLLSKIKDGEEKVFSLDKGKYKIYIKLDWIKSEPIEIEIKEKPLFLEINSKQDKLLKYKLFLSFFLMILSPFIFDLNIYIQIIFYFIGLLLLADFIKLIIDITIKSKKYFKINLIS
ncbi:MAG: hypothetical protein Q7U08_09745 [Flavobacteriaceae bacterium]|nr:hypothetical protein [Flavobacteriaceae bacterium]